MKANHNCRSINLKLTESDFEAIEKKATELDVKTTQYAREITLKGCIKPRYTKEVLDLRRKLAGMANNVNQLARKAHSEGFTKKTLQGIIILDKLKKLLDDSEK